MLEQNKWGVPRLFHEVITRQLTAVHQLAIETSCDPALNHEDTNSVIQALVDPVLCMHCLNVHNIQEPCLEPPDKFKHYLETTNVFQTKTLTVIFPFRYPRQDTLLTEEQSLYGRIYVRVFDMGYLKKVIGYSYGWQDQYTMVSDTWMQSRMYPMREEGTGHSVFRVTTPYEPKNILKGAKAGPVPQFCKPPDTYTVTPSRALFTTAMRNQLYAIHRLQMPAPLTPYWRSKFNQELYYPPICMKCGSKHHYFTTPCIPNILLMQQKQKASRTIHVRARLSGQDGYTTARYRILDGGNFKREIFTLDTRGRWSMKQYTFDDKLYYSTMTLIAPDCFIVNVQTATPMLYEPPNVTAHREIWLKKWYNDITDAEREKLMPLGPKEGDWSAIMIYLQGPDGQNLEEPENMDPLFKDAIPGITWCVDQYPEHPDFSVYEGSPDGTFDDNCTFSTKGPALIY